jgi:hypothetical protein
MTTDVHHRTGHLIQTGTLPPYLYEEQRISHEIFENQALLMLDLILTI